MPRNETRLDDLHAALPGLPHLDLEFDDPAAGAGSPADDGEAWRDSSMDLQQGLDIDELPVDSLPGALRDSFGA